MKKYTLQGTNISPQNGILKMMFLFPRWDMLIPWRVFLLNMGDIPACLLKRQACCARSVIRPRRCQMEGWQVVDVDGKGGLEEITNGKKCRISELELEKKTHLQYYMVSLVGLFFFWNPCQGQLKKEPRNKHITTYFLVASWTGNFRPPNTVDGCLQPKMDGLGLEGLALSDSIGEFKIHCLLP